MTATPLTHHEILALVEPFSRQGHRVDLAASARLERKLAFRPVEHPPVRPGAPTVREVLQLDCPPPEGGRYKLRRVLSRSDGLQATLEAGGEQLDTLLARIGQLPWQQQFIDAEVEASAAPGGRARYAIARSYEYESDWSGAFGTGAEAPGVPLLRRARIVLDGLTVHVNVSAVRGVAADLALEPPPGERLPLPADLLAVIGWDWTRLVARPDGWTSKRRLRGRGARRSAAAERMLEATAAHLARVLAEPPVQFHRRHRLARWGAMLRRLIPTLTGIGLIVGVIVLPRLPVDQEPGLWLALHYVPIGLLAFAFTLQELPSFELPSWPRALHQPRWRMGAPVPAPLSTATPAIAPDTPETAAP